MKKILILLFFFNSFLINDVAEFNQESISSYCIMSMNDQRVIDSYHQDEKRSVASISKIMTAIIAIEHGDLNRKIVIDKKINEVDGSSLYLKVGDSYSLIDLLYGLLLRSGNDAAITIAYEVADNVEQFVKEMNQKAKELGMKNTKFNNPSGLDELDGGNISTSYDMALLMSYSSKNKIFNKIVSTKTYLVNQTTIWKNKNRFLFDYPYATGGKTGYTEKARRTLVTTSRYNGLNVVVVTLNACDDFDLHMQMHDYVYQNYLDIELIKKGTYLINQKKYKLEFIHVTIKKEKLHTLQYSYNLKQLKIIIQYENRKRVIQIE